MWFHIAAAQGMEEAIESLDKVDGLMTSVQIAEAEHFAREWLDKRRK
jgi:hypothetical protein